MIISLMKLLGVSRDLNGRWKKNAEVLRQKAVYDAQQKAKQVKSRIDELRKSISKNATLSSVDFDEGVSSVHSLIRLLGFRRDDVAAALRQESDQVRISALILLARSKDERAIQIILSELNSASDRASQIVRWIADERVFCAVRDQLMKMDKIDEKGLGTLALEANEKYLACLDFTALHVHCLSNQVLTDSIKMLDGHRIEIERVTSYDGGEFMDADRFVVKHVGYRKLGKTKLLVLLRNEHASHQNVK